MYTDFFVMTSDPASEIVLTAPVASEVLWTARLPGGSLLALKRRATSIVGTRPGRVEVRSSSRGHLLMYRDGSKWIGPFL